MTPRVGDFRVTGAHRRRETSSKRARCVDDARDALEPRERRRVTCNQRKHRWAMCMYPNRVTVAIYP